MRKRWSAGVTHVFTHDVDAAISNLQKAILSDVLASSSWTQRWPTCLPSAATLIGHAAKKLKLLTKSGALDQHAVSSRASNSTYIYQGSPIFRPYAEQLEISQISQNEHTSGTLQKSRRRPCRDCFSRHTNPCKYTLDDVFCLNPNDAYGCGIVEYRRSTFSKL
jgi:hypothetical protein